MPVSGEKYVAPVWQNGGPPALDADELNAISQSIVRNQGDIGDLNTLTQQLSAAVGGAAKIEFGSYVGTGTVGSNNKNTLIFELEPKMLIVSYEYNQYSGPKYPTANFIFFFRPTLYNSLNGRSGAYFFRNIVEWGEKSISWYADGTSVTGGSQLNESGVTYKYIVLG